MPPDLRDIDLSGFYLSRYWPMPDLCRILKKNIKIYIFHFGLFESPQANKKSRKFIVVYTLLVKLAIIDQFNLLNTDSKDLYTA
jgi:hypothetical protein